MYKYSSGVSLLLQGVCQYIFCLKLIDFCKKKKIKKCIKHKKFFFTELVSKKISLFNLPNNI